MKYKLIIDNQQEETIIITTHEKTNLIEEIEKLIFKKESNIICYDNEEIIPVKIEEVYAFYTNGGRVYASLKDKCYLVKERIYQLEEIAENFIKINQGCIINPKKIKKFESKISGTIKVLLNNDFSDYVARRELKNVKRRLGLWINIWKNFFTED